MSIEGEAVAAHTEVAAPCGDGLPLEDPATLGQPGRQHRNGLGGHVPAQFGVDPAGVDAEGLRALIAEAPVPADGEQGIGRPARPYPTNGV